MNFQLIKKEKYYLLAFHNVILFFNKLTQIL